MADAIESTADIFSSLIVWGGLHIATRSADEEYPFGYGKAEPLAAAIVALMLLLGAASLIAVQAIEEIRTPRHTPARFTLLVLVGVVIIKELGEYLGIFGVSIAVIGHDQLLTLDLGVVAPNYRSHLTEVI